MPTAPNVTFILGGTRSGKRPYAEMLAQKSSKPKIYIATADAFNREMLARTMQHRLQRAEGWTTLEIPRDIAGAITAPEHTGSFILVDCLTLWLSNVIQHKLDFDAQMERLTKSFQETQAEVVLISSEVGQGTIPSNVQERHYRDYAGVMHQRVAAAVPHVIWIVAGIPTALKGTLPE